MQQGNPGAWVGYVVSAIIISTVLFFRFRSMRRIQKLRLERLWIVPALYALVTASVLYQSVPAGIQGCMWRSRWRWAGCSAGAAGR